MTTIETYEVSMIELRLLRYFVAVAETEHVGRAAQRLHVSQSPLSRQIRQLEDELGTELFVRDGRRIRLTPTGRALVAPARELLARAEDFARDAGHTATATSVAVGFVGTALASGILPRALQALRAAAPGVRIELRQQTSTAQVAAVRAGELDLALVHRPPALERELVAHRVLEEPYRLACERASPLARARLTPARLASLPWIAIAASTRAREDWIAACGAGGFAPHIAVEVADWASALALVDAGAGVALVPASVGRTSPGVVLRAVPWLRMRSSVWLVRRADAAPLLVALERRILAREGHPLARSTPSVGRV